MGSERANSSIVQLTLWRGAVRLRRIQKAEMALK
jgi:hypothetical protein